MTEDIFLLFQPVTTFALKHYDIYIYDSMCHLPEINLNYILIKTEEIPSVHLVFLASFCVLLTRESREAPKILNMGGGGSLEPYELQLPLVGGSIIIVQGCRKIWFSSVTPDELSRSYLDDAIAVSDPVICSLQCNYVYATYCLVVLFYHYMFRPCMAIVRCMSTLPKLFHSMLKLNIACEHVDY
jgi:hypothetical protein